MKSWKYNLTSQQGSRQQHELDQNFSTALKNLSVDSSLKEAAIKAWSRLDLMGKKEYLADLRREAAKNVTQEKTENV